MRTVPDPYYMDMVVNNNNKPYLPPKRKNLLLYAYDIIKLTIGLKYYELFGIKNQVFKLNQERIFSRIVGEYEAMPFRY